MEQAWRDIRGVLIGRTFRRLLPGGASKMTKTYYDIFETPAGWMGLVASEKGLRRSTLPQAFPEDCFEQLGKAAIEAEPSPDRLQPTSGTSWCATFRARRSASRTNPIDVEDASPFHQKAWQACRTIPKGETRTYKWLAEQAGNALAPRAAGQAMARNRLAIIIPCHRVIASDGSLRGFGKGRERLDLKQRLIDLEK